MRPLAVRFVSLALVLSAGCFHQSSAAAPATTDHSVITRDEIAANHFVTAYDVVEGTHQSWFQTRGPDSFASPTQVIVYLDGVRLGGIAALRNIPAGDVAYIRHYNGIDATARWGLDHGAGVIFVATRLGSSNPSWR